MGVRSGKGGLLVVTVDSVDILKRNEFMFRKMIFFVILTCSRRKTQAPESVGNY